MATDDPLILLTNDDGVHAPGLRTLLPVLCELGRVVVVAPRYEQSGSSHAITIERPLRHIEYEQDVHSVDGTPADCVYLALFESRFLPRRPDVVVSGINNGANLGSSVFYSGTVAAAREAAIRGIPAIALSQCYSKDEDRELDFGPASLRTGEMVQRFLDVAHPEGQRVLLNVNFPPGEMRGMRVTRVGQQIYEENVIPRRDPGGREYFWLGGRVTDSGQVENSDAEATADGYVSVTPLELEATKAGHVAMAAHVAADGAGQGEET